MKLKKILAVGMALMLSVGSLTGCSSSNDSSKASSKESTSKREERIKNN